MKIISRIVIALALEALALSAYGAVRVANVFGDNMVLQRGVPVSIWGRAEQGETVTFCLAFQQKKTTAGTDGRWQVSLDPLRANGANSELRIAGSDTIVIKNVLVGDVWLITGSPSLLSIPQVAKPKSDVASSGTRVLALSCRTAKTPQEDIPAAKWQAFGDNSDFFASSFAKAYREHSKEVPVGIIHAVSETPNSGGMIFSGDILEAWAPQDVLAALPWNEQLQTYLSDQRMLASAKTNFDQKLAAWKAKNGKVETPKNEKEYDVWFYEKLASVQQGEAPPVMPTLENIQGPSRVWNGMIAPLTRTPIRGVIFVPGIGNLGNPKAVSPILSGLVKDWRSKWGNPQLPFICLGPWPVGFGDETYVAGSELADAFRIVATLPQAALIPFSDLYDAAKRSPLPNIERLAQRVAPFAADLGEGKSIAVAPSITSATPEGASMVLQVADPNVLPTEGSVVEGFTLYSQQTHWVWAKGTVSKGTIVVTHPKVPAPTAVRYGWMKDSKHAANLTGPTGVPAPVFRSDSQIHCRSMIPNGNIQMALAWPKDDSLRVEAIDIYPVEDPSLPWVMTIGDSIHNGYRFEVRRLLAGVANVVPLTTPSGSKGALGMNRPLWGIKRDELAVLHINHGLHGDLDEPPDEYEPLLDKYFSELKTTVGKGRVIWAATTPIPSRKAGEILDPENNPKIIRINQVARKLAVKHGIAFNDLYSEVAPKLETLSIAKGNVHFNPEGCKALSEAVAQAIRKAISESQAQAH